MAYVQVVGVGMTNFTKPGDGVPYPRMAAQAVRDALQDARIELSEVGAVFAGYVYGDTTSGQRALYDVGIAGAPVVNVNNACATGSTALYLARQAILSGMTDVALAFGFEQMPRGAIDRVFSDWASPWEASLEVADNVHGPADAPFAARLFGGAGREYLEKTGADRALFAAVQVKARRHASHNPRALFRKEVTLEEVLESPEIHAPLTRLMCCPPTCGAAAAVLVSERYARRHGLLGVAIRAQSMVSDQADVFTSQSLISVVGYDMGRRSSTKVYEESGIEPTDIQVAEVHDCFTSNEVLAYEALSLTSEGTSEAFVRAGDNTYGGRCVVNPSGGLLSKGHPLGATGLAQCAELVWQLRGSAGPRQVANARLALQHNVGLTGACVVTLYEKI
ncbi:beta-ketoacyl synthase N-terminal-like domain-containing protein [Microvirga sp. 2YAF29]|uniref:thiolase C-terminal domain-containing protein n=1 Tax=Microvirga sp. 2YAF29 TaxID=3233031 RepID=UPI003F9A3F86